MSTAEEERIDNLRNSAKEHVRTAMKEVLEIITINAEIDMYKDTKVNEWHDAGKELSEILRKL